MTEYSLRAVVFDIGNVLVQWDVHAAFRAELGDDTAIAAFLARCDFYARNLRADGGTKWQDLAAEIEDPADRALFASYPARFSGSITTAIEPTWAVMETLRARGLAIHAITNWSAETWPIGLATHPRLATAFGVTVVSGHEQLLKPDPRIFATFCARAGLAPRECLFIDDSAKNIQGAHDFGMDALLYTGPDSLGAELALRGLL